MPSPGLLCILLFNPTGPPALLQFTPRLTKDRDEGMKNDHHIIFILLCLYYVADYQTCPG